ncbi:stalk domain-containing protein [Paenibacillus periandrae]|uniref:stalk domain-containing protein n=1 Tax=Paenibacillus periandrae TaxID=1761741 RepID=UPI001F09036A|nr:stalk domain-containing protein [Paenibacillus periandrae]
MKILTLKGTLRYDYELQKEILQNQNTANHLGGIRLGKSNKAKLVMSGFVLGAMFFGGVSYAASASERISLEAIFGVKLIHNGIDQTPTDPDQKPFIANGSTYVPLKAISDILGVPVKWDGENNAVIIGQQLNSFILPAPSSYELSGPDYVKGNSSYLDLKQNQPMKVNKKDYGKIGFTLKNMSYETVAKFPLNAQFSNLSLTLGFDDEGANYAAARHISFIDQDGKVLEERTIGPGSVQELNISVKGVLSLHVKIAKSSGGEFPAYIDLINPTLIK